VSPFAVAYSFTSSCLRSGEIDIVCAPFNLEEVDAWCRDAVQHRP
jgi:hypothetical protein